MAGADITQSTLQTTLDNLGIENTVNQLSFAEKRLLIIISLTQQLNASIGDMGRTIESPSNQLRIMSEQWERLSRAVGNVFLPILRKILPYLNAILMVLTEIISTIATLVGYKLEDFDYFSASTTGAWDLDDALTSANSSAKKLKQGLRGFDKLNVITTPSSSGSGASGGVSGGINPKLLEAFNKTFEDYQKALSDVEMKATRIRDRIMEWLGFTEIIDEETGEVSFKFDHITGGTVLGALAVGGTIFLGVSKIFGIFKGIGGLTFGKTLGTAGASTGAGASGLLGILGTLTLLTADVWLIKVATDGLKEAEPEAKDLNKRMESLKQTVNNTSKSWAKNSKQLVDNAKAGKTTEKQNEKTAKSLLDNIHNTEILIKDLENQKNTGNLVVDMWNMFDGTTGKVIQTIQQLNNEQSQDIKLLGEMYQANKLTVEQKKELEDIYNNQIKTLEKERENVKENSRDYEIYTEKINKLKKELENIKGNYNAKLNIDADTTKARKSLSNLLTDINKIGVAGAMNLANALKVLKNASGGIITPNGQKYDIRNYAGGGLPPVGQMFVAREKGPELVGKIGSHTAVMNNEQIVGSVASGVYDAVYKANLNSKVAQNSGTQVYNIYLDKNTKLATYVINQLQDIAKTNGKPIEIGG